MSVLQVLTSSTLLTLNGPLLMPIPPARDQILPFNFCAASLKPFKNPVCTLEGTIFDIEVISQWLDKHETNPVTGKSLRKKDLIKLNIARNGDTDANNSRHGCGDNKGEMIDPVTFKIFTDNTHVVAIRHGNEANVFAWETVQKLNIEAKLWSDLVDDREFKRSDIITLQDPRSLEGRDFSKFKFLKDSNTSQVMDKEISKDLGTEDIQGEKVLKAKEALERTRKERASKKNLSQVNSSTSTGGGILTRATQIQEKIIACNAAQYTTGKAAASFTSTGLTPETSGERALLTDEEYMLRPKKVKNKGYARIETNYGSIKVELQTETAPKAVWNFVHLAKKGYYNGVKFHRNIRNFMIQGGDPTGTGKGGTSIWGKNLPMNLTVPWFTTQEVLHLDRKHTIFGRVVGDLDTLNKLENIPGDEANRPLHDIIMTDVNIFIDPFDEFQKQKKEKEEIENQKEEIKRLGGTEDDRTTWTGKRIRDDNSIVRPEESGCVGKYLKSAPLAKFPSDEDLVEVEPNKKRVKCGGFGNFDNW
ncbi:peptidyl-prolyl cis-trans isomerase cyp8 [Blumeria hordei DH14]|uniref:Peptidyl-prolyl cis-trans isomerase-like 2 n=1 Tax=Blumeria graminis f. sp. hordei (strain DH14) TaxID=546991 RepID=N1J5Q2_BLUG1|nr:peptidyl-prolyl cis-trans isomerase cyp8 [Blumeria hordei DH14]